MSRWLCAIMIVVIVEIGQSRDARGDGKLVPPRDYKGSLEELAQEAMIIFHSSDEPGQATEDLILKIRVEGDADNFAWVIPFPREPKIAKEDPKLFQELFNYVEQRGAGTQKSAGDKANAAPASGNDRERVQVLSRKVVGDYDIAVVRENDEGGLNPWLEENGYQPLGDADDVLKFYRDKRYVFACIKVSSQALATQRSIESHPLRFSFATGGRDGIFFPMKMTGLQEQPFDVNLYVFYRYWINDKLSPFGYRHRGFELNYRDWDARECVPDGGKSYSLPNEDPFLRGMAHHLPTVTKLFQKLYPGDTFYLTNIQANGLKPNDVRQWNDDLWLFPYYTNRNMVPYDARESGSASAGYPNAEQEAAPSAAAAIGPAWVILIVVALGIAVIVAVAVIMVRRRTATGQFAALDKLDKA